MLFTTLRILTNGIKTYLVRILHREATHRIHCHTYWFDHRQ